jgi:hypothetical protein
VKVFSTQFHEGWQSVLLSEERSKCRG